MKEMSSVLFLVESAGTVRGASEESKDRSRKVEEGLSES